MTFDYFKGMMEEIEENRDDEEKGTWIGDVINADKIKSLGDQNRERVKKNQSNWLELLRALPIGEKLTLTREGLGSNYKEQIRYRGNLKQHGYYNPKGGWGLYETSDPELPCYEFWGIPKRKRKTRVYKIGYSVVNIERGWV